MKKGCRRALRWTSLTCFGPFIGILPLCWFFLKNFFLYFFLRISNFFLKPDRETNRENSMWLHAIMGVVYRTHLLILPSENQQLFFLKTDRKTNRESSMWLHTILGVVYWTNLLTLQSENQQLSLLKETDRENSMCLHAIVGVV